jgi:hypothetical protein
MCEANAVSYFSQDVSISRVSCRMKTKLKPIFKNCSLGYYFVNCTRSKTVPTFRTINIIAIKTRNKLVHVTTFVLQISASYTNDIQTHTWANTVRMTLGSGNH